MKGKSLMVMTFLAVMSFVTWGQELVNEAKIVEIYGQEWVDSRKVVQPGMLVLVDKYVSHGFSVMDDLEGKFSMLEPLEMIPLRTEQMESISIEQFLLEYNSADFNPLRYLFFPKVEGQVFRLTGTNKLISILSQDSILSK
jgi:hypothetical protein